MGKINEQISRLEQKNFDLMAKCIRAKAIKELAKKIEDTTWYSINSKGELVVGANGESDVPLYKAEDILKIAEKMVGDNDAN